MPGHVLDACFVEDLRTAALLATSCMNLERPMVGGLAASLDTELAVRVADLIRYGVCVRHLSSAEVSLHASVQAARPALSIADAEALVIAQTESAVLLTGDAALRKAAGESKIAVRGVIGELKRLTPLIVDPPTALKALENIIASGSRLPRRETELARQQWLSMVEKARGFD